MISLIILLIDVTYCIVYILRMDELKDGDSNEVASKITEIDAKQDKEIAVLTHRLKT